MTTYQIISLILAIVGLPSISSIVTWAVKKNKKKKKELAEAETAKKAKEAEEKRIQEARIQAIEKGVQALLRAKMIDEYNKWHQTKKYAPIWAKDNFENCWRQYHNLGVNGVMDGIHEDFMELPTEPPVE
jgi:hypothetical protein